MGFILHPPPPPHAFSVNVVGYARDLGVNELSTSTSKQLAWGLPGGPARSHGSLLSTGRSDCAQGEEDTFVSPLLCRPSLILELNPLILPGNHVKGFYQCT